MNIFEKASRQAVRFETAKGFITTEDLWSLPLQSARSANLDDIAKALYKQIRESDTNVSFVTETSSADDVIRLKFDLVKHVIDVKKTENAANLARSEAAAKKQQLLALIARKQDDALGEKSVDELLAMANSLPG